MQARSSGRVTAVLGPTNTGKTFLAIERMLGHRSGMIGFPLRLLARENYDRVCRLKGPKAVALVTGEERIVPPHASYFICTAESMPLDRRVAFLAVDEIQMAADPERGHVFTERLLKARGEDETMLLGADTIRPALRRLVPEATVIGRPRLSTLSYSGPRKITRLPPRSAIVAFSAAEVYAIAELIRRQRGGAAVVLGALSPRTRNAQVAMFQSGEVDYLVATDAIGMGLNMDLDHVAFAALVKFDGRAPRSLAAAELAQIAGRAGRHMNNGSFGTTAEIGPLDPVLVEAIENHRFDPLKALYWRNDDLNFRSLELLLRSLDQRPPHGGLIRARPADDQLALAALAQDGEIRDMAQGRARLRLLWEVCQIPDFRKVMSDAHARLLGQVFRHLGTSERLPPDWVARHVGQLDRTDGDIDTLTARIAHVRTWTYIAHRADWLADPVHWRERTREIEDRLSDALHERLAQRFVDRRHTVLLRRRRDGDGPLAVVAGDGGVLLDGEAVGRMEGFHFVADVEPIEAGRLAALARPALQQEAWRRLKACEEADDEALTLSAAGEISWQGATLARLGAGDHVLAPRLEPRADGLLEGEARERLRRRLQRWLDAAIRRRLAPLVTLREAMLGGAARGLAFQLVEGLGLLPTASVSAQLDALKAADRKTLSELGLRFGRETIWLPALRRQESSVLALALYAIHRGAKPKPPPSPELSFAAGGSSHAACAAMGYRRIASLAVRPEALERFTRAVRLLARQGSFAANANLCAILACEEPAVDEVLRALGYRRHSEAGVTRYGPPGPPRRTTGRRAKPGLAPTPSPFAALSGLQFPK